MTFIVQKQGQHSFKRREKKLDQSAIGCLIDDCTNPCRIPYLKHSVFVFNKNKFSANINRSCVTLRLAPVGGSLSSI